VPNASGNRRSYTAKALHDGHQDTTACFCSQVAWLRDRLQKRSVQVVRSFRAPRVPEEAAANSPGKEPYGLYVDAP